MFMPWSTPPLRSAVDLVDEGFSVYSVRGEVLYGKLDDLITYIILM